jgi:predicted outer membrane protein
MAIDNSQNIVFAVRRYKRGRQSVKTTSPPVTRTMIEAIEPDAFITSAMMEFMSDVQLGQLALVRGTADSIRLAMNLIDDSNRVILDIARIATRKNLPLPRCLDQHHAIILQRMREKTSLEFDSAYIEILALHHRHAIRLFKRGQTIRNPEISAFASRVLAMIEARIKLSRQLSARIDSLLDGGGLPYSESSTDN